MLHLPRVRLMASLLLALVILAPTAAIAQRTERMRCASVDYKYSYCRTDRPVRWARVARRYSKRPCIEGRTWGYDRRGIWVNNGCDADFVFRMRGNRDRDRDDRYR